MTRTLQTVSKDRNVDENTFLQEVFVDESAISEIQQIDMLLNGLLLCNRHNGRQVESGFTRKLF